MAGKLWQDMIILLRLCWQCPTFWGENKNNDAIKYKLALIFVKDTSGPKRSDPKQVLLTHHHILDVVKDFCK